MYQNLLYVIMNLIADKQQYALPSNWQQLKPSDEYIQVLLSANDEEYKNTATNFKLTCPNAQIFSVMILNLWLD